MIKLKDIVNEVLGPHIGRELELMVLGEKPAALVSNQEYQFRWKPYVKSHLFISEPIFLVGEKHWIITQRDETWRIGAIKRVFNWRKKVKKDPDMPFTDFVGKDIANKHHAKLGLLFGYSKDDIRDFIAKMGVK